MCLVSGGLGFTVDAGQSAAEDGGGDFGGEFHVFIRGVVRLGCQVVGGNGPGFAGRRW